MTKSKYAYDRDSAIDRLDAYFNTPSGKKHAQDIRRYFEANPNTCLVPDQDRVSFRCEGRIDKVKWRAVAYYKSHEDMPLFGFGEPRCGTKGCINPGHQYPKNMPWELETSEDLPKGFKMSFPKYLASPADFYPESEEA